MNNVVFTGVPKAVTRYSARCSGSLAVRDLSLPPNALVFVGIGYDQEEVCEFSKSKEQSVTLNDMLGLEIFEWNAVLNNLIPSTRWYVRAYLRYETVETTGDTTNTIMWGDTVQFWTRSNLRLYDQLPKHLRSTDQTLGNDLEDFMGILQYAADDLDRSVDTMQSYVGVDTAPAEMLPWLGDRIGFEMDQWMDKEDNRRLLREWVAWCKGKATNRSFQSIVGKFGCGCSIKNNALLMAVPSWNSKFSADSCYLPDRFWINEGSLDINIFWWRESEFPDVTRLMAQLETVRPAGFLLWLTFRIMYWALAGFVLVQKAAALKRTIHWWEWFGLALKHYSREIRRPNFNHLILDAPIHQILVHSDLYQTSHRLEEDGAIRASDFGLPNHDSLGSYRVVQVTNKP